MKLLKNGDPSTDRRSIPVDVSKTPMKSDSRRSVVDVPLKGEVTVDGDHPIGGL